VRVALSGSVSNRRDDSVHSPSKYCSPHAHVTHTEVIVLCAGPPSIVHRSFALIEQPLRAV
jgi:hypothetical protein